MRSFSLKSLGHCAVVMIAIQISCANPSGEEGAGSGGSSGNGSGTAGKTASAGSPSSAGATSSTAGMTSTGASGAPSTAGSSNTSGSSAGGAASAGASAGGPSSSAGSPSAAGAGPVTNPGTINWGKEEDPSAKCPVTATLPAYADLKADGKLPDPFLKLDGTRIKDKSEWACRRAEIVKQLAKYIYGEKPIPAKGSVTGTVSTTSISVKVTEGSKTASFSVTVDMNGATAPAPAIITYGAGAPIPKGVAKISLTAIESTGGSGAKMGPFFDFYGSNHPAGYMVAQG